MPTWPPLDSLLNSLLPHSDVREWWLVLMAPLFLVTIGVEWWHMRRTGQQHIHHVPDAMASINLGSIYSLIDVIFLYVLVLPTMLWLYQFRWFTIDTTLLSFAGLYLGVEFCYYWFHRASHRVRWFWCAHSAHHASEYMNFTTALRQSWLYAVAGNWLFYLPMVLLGFDPRWVMFAYALNLTYQFFVHTQWVKQLPAPIEYLFNTPSHHRVHHGRNPKYIDKNYGGTLIIFDRLFGTFEPEVEKPDYGLVHPMHSYNLLWLTVHEWVAMVRDVMRPGPLWLRLKHVWAPPGWERPTGQP